MKNIRRVVCLLLAVLIIVGSVNVSKIDTVAATSKITIEEWNAFKPKITRYPKELKATKKKKLKTNAPAGVKVTYKVSNKALAEVDKRCFFKAKKVGKVKVTATFTVKIDGKTYKKKATCKIKVLGKKKIYIDAGHQTRANVSMEPVGPGSSERKYKVTGGCVGVKTGIPEYQFTLTMAEKLKAALLEEGYDVAMSRTQNDVDISNVQRAIKGNESGADICVRLHADSWTDPNLRGVSVLYPSAANPYPIKKYAAKSQKLAQSLLDNYVNETGLSSRGIVVRNDLSGTNWSTIPTALIELGFFSNPTEDVLLNSEAFQKKMVKGMVKGINQYYGYK